MEQFIHLATSERPKEEPPCFFEPVNDYRTSPASSSWGCICPKCGAFHEFTRGRKWRFCPACGCETGLE